MLDAKYSRALDLGKTIEGLTAADSKMHTRSGGDQLEPLLVRGIEISNFFTQGDVAGVCSMLIEPYLHGKITEDLIRTNFGDEYLSAIVSYVTGSIENHDGVRLMLAELVREQWRNGIFEFTGMESTIEALEGVLDPTEKVNRLVLGFDRCPFDQTPTESTEEQLDMLDDEELKKNQQAALATAFEVVES